MLGALLVNGGKSWLTAAFPTAWLYVLGTLFVGVTLLLPGGVIGAFAASQRARAAVARLLHGIGDKRTPPHPAAGPPVTIPEETRR